MHALRVFDKSSSQTISHHDPENIQTTLFIPTLDTTTKFVIMTS